MAIVGRRSIHRPLALPSSSPEVTIERGGGRVEVGGGCDARYRPRSMNPADEMGQPPVTFTIDGIAFSIEDRRQNAGQLLTLAGVDPADHDLGRVVGQGQVEQFADQDEIQVTPGANFVSIFTGSTPVV